MVIVGSDITTFGIITVSNAINFIRELERHLKELK